MEDGVLTAPAPYSAPSAYYSPTAGRMSGIEVLKGSSQIRFGPHITGGVINYLSTEIPAQRTVYLKSLYGSEDELRTHAYVGDSIATRAGRFGYLVEGYFRETDGFKRTDAAPDFRAGDDTGFEKIEPMVKLAWEPKSDIYQRLEFKYGASDLDANETYLGLSEADFDEDPSRRYAATRFDNIATEHDRSYLRYFVSPTHNLDIVTTAYYNDFKRNWFKLHDLRDIVALGGANMSLSAALAGDGDGAGLAVLRGDAAGTLRVRNNNRNYRLKGVESIATYRFESGATQHEVTAGIRAHADRVRRFQRDERFTQDDSGAIVAHDPGTPGDAGNRLQETEALALYVQDRIDLGRWAFIPGIRWERLDQTHEDYDRPERSGTNQMNLLAGGIGVTYDYNDAWMLFGGVHRGFSPPGPRGAVKDGLEEETSVSIEFGARFRNRAGALNAEAVAFYTGFDDLIVIDNIGGTGTGDDENFGEVDAYGLELSVDFDAGAANDWGFGNPYFAAVTYTNAEQQNDARSTDAESIFSFGEKGNKVPYVPEYAISAGTGLAFSDWGVDLVVTYVDDSFTSADNTDDQINGAGNPDARFGKTDAYTVVDVAGRWALRRGVRFVGGVQNLFDEEYIVSRQPHGPRPGQPRFVYAGVEIEL